MPFSDSYFPVALADLEQQFKSVLATNISSEYESILRSLEVRCSSWRKMKRVIVYVLRFIRYWQKKRYQSEEITVLELEQSEKAIIKALQEQYLSEEILKLKSSTECISPKLCKLDPFLDKDGIVRVGRRLQNSDLQIPVHTYVIPKESAITRRIIEYYHNKVKRVGRTSTIAEVRCSGEDWTSRTTLNERSCKIDSKIHRMRPTTP